MKKIKSFYYEIVISKIYMLEKYKREFGELYKHFSYLLLA
jgi:hypothetical protein